MEEKEEESFIPHIRRAFTSVCLGFLLYDALLLHPYEVDFQRGKNEDEYCLCQCSQKILCKAVAEVVCQRDEATQARVLCVKTQK